MRKTRVYSKKRKQPILIMLMLSLIIFVGLMLFIIINPQEKVPSVFDGGLPVIVIDTNNQDIAHFPDLKETIINGQTQMQRPNSDQFIANLSVYLTDPYITQGIVKPQLSSEIVINTRGQSSLYYPKKQYTVRLIDKNGYENHQEMVNMPKHDKWVLNGLYSDKTFIRNYLAYQMGRQTMEYGPNAKFVEVYIKTKTNQSKTDQYQGIYLLTEKIERDINRVNIKGNDAKFSDTSFIMARDKVKLDDEIIVSDWATLEDSYVILDNGFIKQKTLYTPTYPSSTNMTEKNRKDILKSLNDFEYALKSENFRDKTSGYNKYIDVESFVNFSMIQEITKNIDGGEVSSYFYKDLGGKIKAGPVWDFDMSMKNTGQSDFDNPTGFTMLNTVWYERLFQDEFFAKRFQNNYKKYRKTIWSNININGMIDKALLEILPAIDRNNSKWYPEDTNEVFSKEVEELRDFLISRLQWMDENISLVKRITESVIE